MLPPDLATATVRFGPFLDDVGRPWCGRVTIRSSHVRVWQATGAVLAPRPVVVDLDEDGFAELTLARTDQPGFTDPAGAPLTWGYEALVELDGAEAMHSTFLLTGPGVPSEPVAPDAEAPVATPAPRTAVEPASARPAGVGGPVTAPVDAVGRDRGVRPTRRGALRAAVAAVGAVSLTAAAASSAAARTPGATALPSLQPIDDDVTIGSTAHPRTLRIPSSAAGGSAGGTGYFDSTGRILLESYQPHFNSYGECVRVALKDARAKGMLTYQANWPTPHYPDGDFTWLTSHPTQPVTIAWIGAHFLNNDDPSSLAKNLWHGHINFEVPDSTGSLRTRLEIKLIDPVTGKIGTDLSAVRTNMADFEVQVGKAGEQLRIVGDDTRNRDLVFAAAVGATQPRWTLRATAGDGDLELRRHAADNRYVDSPLRVDRQSGLVEVGGAAGSSAGVVVRQSGGVALTLLPQQAGGTGLAVTAARGDSTAQVLQGSSSGDGRPRFTLSVDGTMRWGSGTGDRDTQLYRRGAGQLGTDGAFFLRSSTVPPTATTGGVLFVQDGALRYRGSKGTVTTLAPA